MDERKQALLDAVSSIDLADWEVVRPLLLPLMARRDRPSYIPAHAMPVQRQIADRLVVEYAVDVGPGFANVSVELLGAWHKTVNELHGPAIENLRRVVGRDGIRSERFDDVGVIAIQGEGWGSSLLLLGSELIDPILGDGEYAISPVTRNSIACFDISVWPDPSDVAIGLRTLQDQSHDDGAIVPLVPFRWFRHRLALVTDGARFVDPVTGEVMR